MASDIRNEGPLILVVGSAAPGRTDYDPPITSVSEAPIAAQQLGGALAKAGFRLIVFSSDPAYLEAAVVRGFVRASNKRAYQQIQVRAPQGSNSADFELGADSKKILQHRPDPATHWLPSFYKALNDANGVLIIGGGRTALIAGYLALSMQLPLLTVACFGGAARRIWMTVTPGVGLPTQDECDKMGRPIWQSEYSDELVGTLKSQIERKVIRRRKEQIKPLGSAALGLTLIGIMVAMLTEAGGGTLDAALLFGIGPIGGAAGATARSLAIPDNATQPLATTLLLGAASGLIISLAYLVAQFSASGGTTEIRQIAVASAWTAITSFAAGFAFERTLRQLAAGKLKAGGRNI